MKPMNLNMRQNSGDSAHLKKGMPVAMTDGWTGKVAFVTDDLVHCDEDGPNPHCTGRAVELSSVTIDRGSVTVNWNPVARSNKTRRSPIAGKKRRAVVVDLNRAILAREWRDAPEY